MIKELLDQSKESDSIACIKNRFRRWIPIWLQKSYAFHDFLVQDGVQEKGKKFKKKLQALVFEKHSSAQRQNLFQHTDSAASPIILESYRKYFTSPSGKRLWEPLR